MGYIVDRLLLVVCIWAVLAVVDLVCLSGVLVFLGLGFVVCWLLVLVLGCGFGVGVDLRIWLRWVDCGLCVCVCGVLLALWWILLCSCGACCLDVVVYLVVVCLRVLDGFVFVGLIGLVIFFDLVFVVVLGLCLRGWLTLCGGSGWGYLLVFWVFTVLGLLFGCLCYCLVWFCLLMA